jgi:hypothetical protein
MGLKASFVRLIFIFVAIFLSSLYSLASGQPNKKGEFYLHISIPYINSTYFHPEDESEGKVNSGFLGLSAGVDYFHTDEQYLNLTVSAVTNFPSPLPGFVEMSGEYEYVSSVYLSLSNNHKIKKFTMGYGVSFGRNIWEFRYSDDWDPPPLTRDTVSTRYIFLGFVVTVYYRIGESIFLGIIYRPTFYRFDIEPRFKYEHLISVDFAMKIKL